MWIAGQGQAKRLDAMAIHLARSVVSDLIDKIMTCRLGV
jgi:hypothetical protein